VRSADFKYVHFSSSLPPLLFDLSKDPGELNNVANDPAYLPVRLEFAERMLAWRAAHLDQSLAMAERTEDGVAGYVSRGVGE
ncbi:phosphonate monoester hydrolase, partial [Mesorhizobium sp. M3A.F.Ca.ET.175.01.1.1]